MAPKAIASEPMIAPTRAVFETEMAHRNIWHRTYHRRNGTWIGKRFFCAHDLVLAAQPCATLGVVRISFSSRPTWLAAQVVGAHVVGTFHRLRIVSRHPAARRQTTERCCIPNRANVDLPIIRLDERNRFLRRVATPWRTRANRIRFILSGCRAPQQVRLSHRARSSAALAPCASIRVA